MTERPITNQAPDEAARETHALTPEEQEAKEQVIERLRNGFISGAIRVIEDHSLSDDVIASQEIQSVAKSRMLLELRNGILSDVHSLVETFSLPAEWLASPEVISVAQERVRQLIKKDSVLYALDVLQMFSLSAELLHSPEAQTAAKTRIIDALGNREIEDALHIAEQFSLPQEVLNSPEIQSQAKNALIDSIKRGDEYTAIRISEKFSLPQTVLTSPEIQSAAKERIIMEIERGGYRVFDTARTYSVPKNFFDSPEVHAAAKRGMNERMKMQNPEEVYSWTQAFSLPKDVIQSSVKDWMIRCLKGNDADLAANIFEKFSLPIEIAHSAVKEGLIFNLSHGNASTAFRIYEKFSLPQEILTSPEVQSAAREGMDDRFKHDYFDDALHIAKMCSLSEEVVQFAAKKKLIDRLKNGDVDGALYVAKMFSVMDESILTFFEDESIPKKIRYSNEVVAYLSNHLDPPFTYGGIAAEELDPVALRARQTVGVPPMVYARTKHFDKLDPAHATPEQLMKSWMMDVQETASTEIQDGMFEFITQFGDKITLQYLNRVDLSAHDAFYFVDDIIKLQALSRLESQAFGSQILSQVARDGALYEEGSAHHRFAAVCRELAQTDFTVVFKKAKAYENVTRLQQLVDEIGTENFASSWKTMKKTYELVQLLKRTEILDELNSSAVDPRMRAFVERLAFHPNISTEAVIRFWKDPAGFLDIDDLHTQGRINEVKKPSNYLSLPYLGLTAEDLRDAYVFGEMDKLQTLPPMERTYVLGEGDLDDVPKLYERFFKAVGRRSEGVKGVARNPGAVLRQATAVFQEAKISIKELADQSKGVGVLSKLNDEQRRRLAEMIQDQEIGLASSDRDVYRIRIGSKSDPEMAVAGNDTASCMPFGSGKNNVYMFNPNCTQLVVERRSKDGSWRTAAQSVMTIDHVTSTPTPELIERYQETNGHISDLISQEDFLRLPVVTCDNIEVAKNEEGDRVWFIRETYERFFKEYLTTYGKVLGVDLSRVAVGTGYTPDSLGLKQVKNTFVPQAPMGYSDNVSEKTAVIDTGLAASETSPATGVALMTTRDALAVAMLEGKAYKDSETLLTNLHHMQNAIIGMEIANAHFKRPNLSFMYRDAKGMPRGYVLAYEGISNKLSEIFIDDLASDRTNRMAGGRLINRFFENYLANYGTADRPFIPIFTNARESTSYPILKANVDRLAERAGLHAEMVEVGSYRSGEETMHNVRIHIARTREELEEQKQRYESSNEYESSSEGESETQDDRW